MDLLSEAANPLERHSPANDELEERQEKRKKQKPNKKKIIRKKNKTKTKHSQII
jgi:hypothetical protein